MAKSGGHKYFFRIFIDFQSQTETKKRQKSTFQISKIQIKKRLKLWPKVFRDNVGHKKDQFSNPISSLLIYEFSKFEKSIFTVFWVSV